MFKKNYVLKSIILIILFSLLHTQISCSKKELPNDDVITMKTIETMDQLKQIIDTSDKMLVFDLYADWCVPCKVLAPILNSLSRTHKDKAAFFKVDVDKNPEIAGAFGVRGIPLVVFVKNKKVIYSITGVNPQENYEKVIYKCSDAEDMKDCEQKLEL